MTHDSPPRNAPRSIRLATLPSRSTSTVNWAEILGTLLLVLFVLTNMA